jgi:hypothetical protein
MVGYINGKQSKEQRNNKYRFMRDCGIGVSDAIKLRSWSYNHIILFLYNKNIKAEYNSH